jgi:hypothetical protein
MLSPRRLLAKTRASLTVPQTLDHSLLTFVEAARLRKECERKEAEARTEAEKAWRGFEKACGLSHRRFLEEGRQTDFEAKLFRTDNNGASAHIEK